MFVTTIQEAVNVPSDTMEPLVLISLVVMLVVFILVWMVELVQIMVTANVWQGILEILAEIVINSYLKLTYFTFFIEAIGCLAGGLLSCQNGGTCFNINNYGSCQCPLGYSGTNCEIFLGCTVGAQYSCQNGGTCSSNGTCQCAFAYSGNSCSNCNNFSLVFSFVYQDFSISNRFGLSCRWPKFLLE